MRNLRIFKLLLVVSLFALSSCEKYDIEVIDNNVKNDEEQIENLEQSGILGRWKLETRTRDGITGLNVECCDYIEFKTNNETEGLKGEFQAFGTGYENNGIFELNTTDNAIHFNYNNSIKSYEFQVYDDMITFSYSENDQAIIEDWRKQ